VRLGSLFVTFTQLVGHKRNYKVYIKFLVEGMQNRHWTVVHSLKSLSSFVERMQTMRRWSWGNKSIIMIAPLYPRSFNWNCFVLDYHEVSRACVPLTKVFSLTSIDTFVRYTNMAALSLSFYSLRNNRKLRIKP
jgi:hypothetical protein